MRGQPDCECKEGCKGDPFKKCDCSGNIFPLDHLQNTKYFHILAMLLWIFTSYIEADIRKGKIKGRRSSKRKGEKSGKAEREERRRKRKEKREERRERRKERREERRRKRNKSGKWVWVDEI